MRYAYHPVAHVHTCKYQHRRDGDCLGATRECGPNYGDLSRDQQERVGIYVRRLISGSSPSDRQEAYEGRPQFGQDACLIPVGEIKEGTVFTNCLE